MGILFPLLAAILQAGSFTLDKVILSMRRVSFKTYTGVSFPLIFFITLCIFLIFRPPFSFDLLQGTPGLILLVSIAFMIAGNLLFYRALDDDRLSEIQTIELLHGVPMIIFSSIVFADERKFVILIPAIVATLAVMWAHWGRHRFLVKQHTLPFLLLPLITAPIGASISKILLASWNPISLELVRSGAVALVLGPLFSRHVRGISLKPFSLLLATNVLTSVAWILFYFSYQRIGIVHTLLLFSLQPLLVYFAAVVFLKEKLHWKKSVAFVIVLISIITAQMLG